MSTTSVIHKKFIIYDHKMEYLKEVIVKQEDKISKETQQILNRSIMFLEYGNTYYYRDIDFMQEG